MMEYFDKHVIDFSVGTFKHLPFDIGYLLNNAKDKDEYNKIISDTKTRALTEEEINTFVKLCETAELNKETPATLDNIFIKNGGSAIKTRYELQDIGSDHYAVFSEIFFY